MRPGRTALSITAIALSVALYVSSDIANASVRASFEKTMNDLAGKAEWQITRGRTLGVEESVLHQVKSVPGAVAAPIIQASVTLPELKEGTLLLLGIDFWKDSPLRLYKFEGAADPQAFVAAALIPGSIVVTRTFADRHRLKVGSRLKINTRAGISDVRVGGIMESEGPARVFGGNVAIMDLRSAQKLFGKPGFVDRIEVAGADPDALKRAVGPEYTVDRIVRGNSTLEDGLARIDSLVVVSIIALLVGMIIIYQTVSISVLERTKEIGIYRALGKTRKQVLRSLLIEWGTIGFVGAAVGIGLGYLFARALISYTAGTINAIVMLVDVNTIELSPIAVATALAGGTAASIVAVLVPALRAADQSLIELLRPGLYAYRHAPNYRWQLAAGALLAGGGSALIVASSRLPTHAGLLSSVLVFLGIALMLPQLTLGFAAASRPILRTLFRIEGFLATDSAAKFPQRTALTVVSLGGALAMMVSTATLVKGFDVGAHRWMDAAFPFDLTVSATDFATTIYGQSLIPETVREQVQNVRGVRRVYGMQKVFSDYQGKDIMVIAFDSEPYFAMRREKGMPTWSAAFDDPQAIRRFQSGEGVFVSENMGAHFRLKAGDRFDLPTPLGIRTVEVLALLEDYSWPRGVVAMERSVYRQLWNDPDLTYVDVGVDPAADRAQVRADIARALSGRFQVFLYDVNDLKRIAEDTMRQTVQLANMQVVIALVIGFLGIANTLVISVLRRQREIGLLRAIGMSCGQIARTVVIEATMIALAAGIIGAAGGIVGAAFPLRLHTYQITGYWVPLAIPWFSVALALGTSIAIGLAASVLPARRAANVKILEAIGYE
jgi:putative ABC transport system permease protein